VRMKHDHAIRVILGGSKNDDVRPPGWTGRPGRPPKAKSKIVCGNRERFKMWLLSNPQAIPRLLARRLEFQRNAP